MPSRGTGDRSPARRGHARARLYQRAPPRTLLAEQLDFVDLAKVDLDETAVDCVPEPIARRAKAIGYAFANSVLLVAVADATDDRGMEEVREAARRRVRFKVALQSEVESALHEAYGEPQAAAGPVA